jgi:hypothetical protein
MGKEKERESERGGILKIKNMGEGEGELERRRI